MKTYIVKTASAVNSMLLHSSMKEQFTTNSLEEANKVFDDEVEELAKCYTKASDLSYSPTDNEYSNAIFCEICEQVSDENGEVDDVESIKLSTYFFK